MFSIKLNYLNIKLSILILLLLIINLIKCNPTNQKNYQKYNEMGSYYRNELSSPLILHKFNVQINFKLESYENVAIIGNDINLGNWLPENGILLKKNQNNNKLWYGDIKIPFNKLIEYRYYIISYDKLSQNTIIRYWENNLLPRKLINSNSSDEEESIDIFGYYTTNKIIEPIKEQISHGWLNGQNILQLKFLNNPFKYNNWTNLKRIGIYIKPFKYDLYKNEINNDDNIQNIFEDDELLPNEAIVEVSKMKYNYSKLILQNNNNEIIYLNNDMIIFHITLTKLNNIGYYIKLTENDNNFNQIPLGYQYILPTDIKNSEGDLELPIISLTSLNQPIGFMNISYLVINSLKLNNKNKLNLYTTFTKYWHKNWYNLDFGHRGLGVSFKYTIDNGPPAPENTIASFKLAGLAGADGIEFDVHLTKDLLPIIYHDFHIYINMKMDKPKSKSDLIKILIKDLTYQQLKSLRTYQILSNNQIIEYKSYNEEKLKDYRLFPLLEDLFHEIDLTIGFDIEIKWPQKRQDGSLESIQTIDKNLFADRILNVILENGCNRMIFMSSFDPDLITMLRYKQNKYPVMFLTIGETNIYQKYLDPRCHSIENAITNSIAWDLLGAIPYTEDYFNNNNLANLANINGQPSFCWGKQANSTNSINQLKEFGLTGVIYDRIDKLLPNNKTKSIFNNDEYKNIFQMQCSYK